ncbi:hypothetical protein ACFL04_00800 [Patescibacteria group bacterium]
MSLISTTYFWKISREFIPHVVVMFAIFGSVYFLYKWRQSNKSYFYYISLLLAILAPFISYWALFFILLFPWLVYQRTKKLTFWLSWLPISLLFLYWSIKYYALGEIFLMDLYELFNWQQTGGLLGDSDLLNQFIYGLKKFVFFLGSNFTLLPGLLGLLLIKDRWLRNSLLAIVIIGGVFIFRTRDYIFSQYLTIILIPFLALGAGVILAGLFSWLKKMLNNLKINILFYYLILASFIMIMLVGTIFRYVDIQQIRNETVNYYHKIYDTSDFVNSMITPMDYIIAPSEIYWRIHSDAMVESGVYAREFGRINDNFRANYRTEDKYFNWDTDVANAKFVVRRSPKMLKYNHMDDYIVEQTTDWPLVFSNDYYLVYKNEAID